MDGAIGPTGPAGAGLVDDLTRIVGTSWRHNATNVTIQNVIEVDRLPNANQEVRFGFVVAFGTTLTNDPNTLRQVRFGPGLIDDNTFEMFFLEQFTPATQPPLTSEFYAKIPRRLGDRLLNDLIPVNITRLDANGAVLAATELPTSATGIANCNGAAIVWTRDLFALLRGRRVFVQLRGDFVLDQTRRSVDGDFLLGTLPSGDRVPGGTFWSWVRL